MASPPIFISASTCPATAGLKVYSHTVADYANRILIVIVGSDTTAPTNMTYGGVAMTLLTSANDGASGGTYVYYLLAQPVGVANLQITTAHAYPAFGALNYANVNQTDPFGTSNSATGSSVSPSVVVTSETNQLVIDAVCHYSATGTRTLTPGGGQTERIDYNAIGGGGAHHGIGSSEEAGASSVTMSQTISSSEPWVTIGIPLKPYTVPRTRSVAYIEDLASDNRRLLDIQGNRLGPWEIRADNWIRYSGWAPVTSTVFDSLVDDPACGYIEEVSWESEGEVATTVTSRMDQGDIIIARASAQSTG